jgi:hypothetical protein
MSLSTLRSDACPYASFLGIPLELVKPEAMRFKAFEPLLLLGKQRYGFLDIRLRVKGGGHVSQIYGEYLTGHKRPEQPSRKR